MQVRVEVHRTLPAGQPEQEPAANTAKERGKVKGGHEPHEEVEGPPIAHEEMAQPPEQRPREQVRDERPELHEEPNAPEPPWDADTVVGVAAAAEGAEAREEAGKERSQQVRAPQPVDANRTAEREEKG